jgi:hypothetical protein
MPKTTKTAFYNPLILLTFFGPKKFNDFKVLAVSTKTVCLEKLNVTKMSQRPLGADSAVSSLKFTFSNHSADSAVSSLKFTQAPKCSVKS